MALASWTSLSLGGEVPESTEQTRDFFSDASFQKFLDTDHLLSQDYVPADLEPIHSVFTSNKSTRFQLRAEAARQFADMARAFSHAFDFKVKLTLVSAWRSSQLQKELARNCSETRCADAGASEHEAGLAVDLAVNGGNMMRNG